MESEAQPKEEETPLTLTQQSIFRSGPPQPLTIVSLNELLQTREATMSFEQKDRDALATLTTIDEAHLRSNLLVWVGGGVPDNFKLYTIQLVAPPVCSDGASRDILSYISYIVPGFSIVQILSDLEARLPGMRLTYSYTRTTLCVHVSKK